MNNYAGRVLAGRYTLLHRIATGAMGEVWAARDSVTTQMVAAKVLRPELAGQSTYLQRLRVEARNAMKLEHPNLAAVLDHGEEDGLGWIVMELVGGEPFHEYLRGGNRIAPNELLPVIIQTAHALQEAKRRGVVHRDIKPSNILVTDTGFVKLTDFGISVAPDQATMTEAGMVMGTAQYLPPEQAKGEDATHLGDIYALGVIMYEALAGRRPFTGKNQVDIAFAHVNDPVPPLPDDVPDELARVVMRMLKKKPSERPADAMAVIRELSEAARVLGIDTQPKPVTMPRWDEETPANECGTRENQTSIADDSQARPPVELMEATMAQPAVSDARATRSTTGSTAVPGAISRVISRAMSSTDAARPRYQHSMTPPDDPPLVALTILVLALLVVTFFAFALTHPAGDATSMPNSAGIHTVYSPGEVHHG